MAQRLTNPTSIHEDTVRSLALLSGLRTGIAVSCDVGCSRSSDHSLLWLRRKLVTLALIRPLA